MRYIDMVTLIRTSLQGFSCLHYCWSVFLPWLADYSGNYCYGVQSLTSQTLDYDGQTLTVAGCSVRMGGRLRSGRSKIGRATRLKNGLRFPSLAVRHTRHRDTTMYTLQVTQVTTDASPPPNSDQQVDSGLLQCNFVGSGQTFDCYYTILDGQVYNQFESICPDLQSGAQVYCSDPY